MSRLAVAFQQLFPSRSMWKIEQVILFAAIVTYAVLVSLGQKASLLVVLLASLTLGNLLIPLAWTSRRVYETRAFPWNWALFFPVQIALGFVCSVGLAFILRWTSIDREPFWAAFRRLGPLVIVVVVVTSAIMFTVDQYHQKLQVRNELLQQTVEKGTIAQQQQAEELKRAGEIQQMLLPSALPQLAGVQIAGAWQPAREVGGDYFDVIALDEKRLGICIGDVAGKGITAALLMANLQASFRAFATPDASPQEVCTKLNKFLSANLASGRFVTFFYGVLDSERRTLIYENAGHCPGLLIRADGAAERLRGGGAVLGVFPDWIYQDSIVQLERGDTLLLATDGVTEAENSRLEEFGEQRLLEAACTRNGSALDTQRAVMQQVTAYCGGNFRDDATLLVLRFS
ncbi:MAG: PP2C family protein-serine/threonine phosphatase [Candidatus Acidiferrales bacterium]